jgi:RHS repeat-associated protein
VPELGKAQELSREMDQVQGAGHIYGQWLRETNDAGLHHYSYDTLGRLTAADNTPTGGPCASRTYVFNADSNRTLMKSFGPDTDGSSCQSSSGPTNVSHGYDIADRLTDSGVTYDAFGRITSLPAADTSNATTLSSGYYTNDLVRSQTQGSTSECWSLDASRRLREATTYAASICSGSVTADRTNHFDDSSSDSPDWIAENAAQTNWTMNIQDLIGGLAITVDQTGTPTYGYSNLHGDTLASAPAGAVSPTVSTDYDEYGNPIDYQNRRYGWLGEKQRSGEDLGGNVLMGVRVYNPMLGRFLQTDPVIGGSANRYDYAGQDPTNRFDFTGRYTDRPGAEGNGGPPDFPSCDDYRKTDNLGNGWRAKFRLYYDSGKRYAELSVQQKGTYRSVRIRGYIKNETTGQIGTIRGRIFKEWSAHGRVRVHPGDVITADVIGAAAVYRGRTASETGVYVALACVC